MATNATGKRIVFVAEPDESEALQETAKSLRLSKIATLRFAVSLLAEITDELTHGQRIVLKDKENNEREILIPQLRNRCKK